MSERRPPVASVPVAWSVTEGATLLSRRTVELTNAVKDLTAVLRSASESSGELVRSANRFAAVVMWCTVIIGVATVAGVVIPLLRGR